MRQSLTRLAAVESVEVMKSTFSERSTSTDFEELSSTSSLPEAKFLWHRFCFERSVLEARSKEPCAIATSFFAGARRSFVTDGLRGGGVVGNTSARDFHDEHIAEPAGEAQTKWPND